MNDFERQLSNQPLRQPPPEWRAGILSAVGKIVVPAWTWRDWFWPSPLAWGALAAVWIGAFVLGGNDESAPARSAGESTVAVSTTPSFYAFAPHRDFSPLLNTLN